MSNPPADSVSASPPAPLSPRGWLVFALVFLASVIPTLLWPGDTLFRQDEPKLLAMSWYSNHDHEVCSGGLYGNFGVQYGPLAAQIYQVLLLISPDPAMVGLMRTLLCSGVTTLALLWLARTLEFLPWYVLAVSLSPRLWQFQRIMWDASFAIPLGMLAVASLAAYLRSPARWKLLLAIAGMILVPLIHPQGLPLCAALGLTLLWKCREDLWLHRYAIVILVGAIVLVNIVYLTKTVATLIARLGGAVHGGYPNGGSRAVSALAPFLGSALLSDFGYTGWEVLPLASIAPFVDLAKKAILLIYPLAWAGLLVIVWRSLRPPAGARGPREIIGVLVLLCLLFQAGLFGLMRIPSQPQYFFGTFGVHVLLPWFALSAIPAALVRQVFTATYGTAAALLTANALFSTHLHGFNPRTNRLTIDDTKAVAAKLNAYSDTEALTNVILFKEQPQVLRTIRLLLPAPAGTTQRHSGRLVLQDRIDPATNRRHVEVIENDTFTTLDYTPFPPFIRWWKPGPFFQMEITPLPKGWVPDQRTWFAPVEA